MDLNGSPRFVQDTIKAILKTDQNQYTCLHTDGVKVLAGKFGAHFLALPCALTLVMSL